MLGGGLGGLTAAFYLSSTPELRQRFRVTLFTDGHQLGGKAASYRGVQGRIEEHGLHVMLGFYENTFRLLRQAWTPRGPFVDLFDAFSPHWRITFPEHALHGDVRLWERWTVDYPERPGLPGDGEAVELDLVADIGRWIDGVLEGLPLRRPGLDRLEDLGDWLAEEIDKPRLHAAGDAIRRHARLAQLGICVLRGYRRDVLPHGPEAFERIDHLDFRDWLQQHGADEELANWAPVRAFYSLGFAREIAAGVALRVVLRHNLAYKKAPVWRMNAGMGEVVIAPIYEALRRQGVGVRFFHRVERLGLGRKGQLASIRMAAANVPWEPLEVHDGLPCWKAEGPRPLRSRRVLRRGREFDDVVLALPAPALPSLCKALRRVEGWGPMLDGVPTAATRAAQLWLRRPSEGPDIVSGYAEPWDSWADMSHLLSVEHVDAASLHYGVGLLDEGEPELDAWLDWHGPFLWPREGARWDRSDEVMRYVRANREGSARYVQSPPGSIRLRLAPDASGVPNLVLAGDWTRTTLSAGSAEAAVQSGMLAARALGGHPEDIAM